MLKKLSLVTGVLVILGVALWFAQGNMSSTSGSSTNETILAKLDTEKLARVTIQSDAKKKVELVKGSEEQWVVKGMNYEADPKKLQELFLKLLDTKLGEKVTDQAKHHARFHLVHVKENQDQWEAEKTGKLLTLNGKEGSPILEILLGKSRSEKLGQYIRYAHQPAVYLITEDIRVGSEENDWLNTSITDFDGDKLVKTLELQHAGAVFRFVREKEGEEWKAQGELETEEINPSAVQSLGNALRFLSFEKIVPMDTSVTEVGRETLAYYTAELFDGRIVKANVGATKVADGENYYLAIEMTLRDGVTEADLKEQVDAFNQRSKPWLYGLKSWIGERFLKGRDDLIVKKKESE